MTDRFQKHIAKFVAVSDAEFDSIAAFFQTLEVKKKVNLLTEGQVCKYHYFVLDGCLRKFFINDKGIEQTTEFAIEHWWITDNLAYEQQRPTEFFIQAVERSQILRIDYSAQQALLQQHPIMERYFRCIYQRAYAAAQMRIKYLYDYSKDEMFHHFSRQYPDFVRRIPQYLIASFLGFTPEYLSELKKKAAP